MKLLGAQATAVPVTFPTAFTIIIRLLCFSPITRNYCGFVNFLHSSIIRIFFVGFFTRDAGIERIVALLPWCPSIYRSVCLFGTGVHCDHTVHVIADLSSWLYSPVFWAPWHQSMSTYCQPSFSRFTWKRGGVWMCKLGIDVNANVDK